MAATITRSSRPKLKAKKAKKTTASTSGGMKSKKSSSDLSAMLMLGSELLSSGQFNEGLPSFVTRGLDAEQIWQQLELRNDHKLGLAATTRNAVKVQAGRPKKTPQTLPKKPRRKAASESEIENENKEGEENGSESSDQENDMLNSIKRRLERKSDEGSDNFDDFEESEGEENDVDFDFELEREIAGDDSDDMLGMKKKVKKEGVKKKAPKRTTIVDDKFFKLADLEEFLESEDAREEKRRKREEKQDKEGSEEESEDEDDEDDELIDMFEEEDSDDDPSTTAKYADFFDPPDESASQAVKEKGKRSKNKIDKDGEEDDIGSEKGDEDEEEGEESGDDEEQLDDQADDLNLNDDEAVGTDEEEDEEEMDEDNNDSDAADDSDEDNTENQGPGKKVSFARDLLDSDEEDESGKTTSKEGVRSTFEMKQEKLRQQAQEMEDLSLKDPSWELTGEATASKRPENSLLETVLDFQHTHKAAPVITDDTTKSLEDYIKQRIKDKTFDDVERKEKPKEDVLEFKKRIVLDQEKSKLSLGELYEQEFLKQQQQNEDEVKEDPECEAIEKDLNQLFKQLDALSNFKYTPMKPGTEVKIIVNTPAISMEEVAPVATADAELLAPEEVHEKKRGDLKADDERDSTDKKRARRQKKKEKREKKKAKEAREKVVEKMKPGLGNKYSKAKALKQLEQIAKQDRSVSLIQGKGQKLGSSSSFFTQLQEEVQTNAKAKKASKDAKKKVKDASALML